MAFLKAKYALVLLLALIAAGLGYFYQSNHPESLISPEKINTEEKSEDNSATDLGQVSAESILSCLNKSGISGNCLDALFHEFMKDHTPVEALALVTEFGEKNSTIRVSCHPVVHAIGRETLLIKKTVQDSFPACDQTCHSGCYHGVMERFLRGEGASSDNAGHISQEEVKAKAATACDPGQPLRFRFQCLHGLGHALVFFLDYNLLSSLQSCDVQPDGWSRSSCYGGAFMENVFSATPEKRDLSKTDYHYPCSKLEAKYKFDCYMMQTTRMSEMGLNTDRLFMECKKVGIYQQICMQSIGRDLSNDARIGEPKLVAAKCEKVTGLDREACTRGVAYALLDNTWTGQYAFPFCASFTAETDRQYCFQISTSYLKTTFETTPAEIENQCGQYTPQNKLCK